MPICGVCRQELAREDSTVISGCFHCPDCTGEAYRRGDWYRILCPRHGPQFLSYVGYLFQSERTDEPYRCPSCNQRAELDQEWLQAHDPEAG